MFDITFIMPQFQKNKISKLLSVNLQGEWDDFRTFRWIEEIESVDLSIEESRELLKI